MLSPHALAFTLSNRGVPCTVERTRRNEYVVVTPNCVIGRVARKTRYPQLDVTHAEGGATFMGHQTHDIIQYIMQHETAREVARWGLVLTVVRRLSALIGVR
jgi:hypothetical protein